METSKIKIFNSAQKSKNNKKISDTVKGFRDISGEEAIKQEKIKEILLRNFKNYGFEPAETPVIEYEEFVKQGNEQDEAVSDIFKLQDKGERKLALRYEFTFQLKRIAEGKKLPYKRYQIGEVFRDEPTSAFRFRQIMQCDVDVVGSTIKEEAEILALTSAVLKELGIKATININNRKLLNEILESEGIKKKNEVMKEIDKFDKLPENEVKAKLKKYNAENLIALLKKPESFFKKYKAYGEIEELKKYCSYYNVGVKFQPNLARGLSYYNGSVFEVKTLEMKESIVGGGSYSINGIESTGISFGLDRISQFAKIKTEEKKILLISIARDEEAIKLAEMLRKKNIPLILMYKVSKALDYANSKKIPFVIFVGEREIKQKKFKLRNMSSGKEEMLTAEKLLEKLKKAEL